MGSEPALERSEGVTGLLSKCLVPAFDLQMKDRCRDPWVVQSPATDRERQVLAVLVCHSTPVGRFVLTVHPFNRTCNKEFVASRAGKGSRRGKVQHTLGYCWRTLSVCSLSTQWRGLG